MTPDEELRQRLKDPEDGWVERKSNGVSTEDITKTVVAFANSLPDGHQGVLFIGIADKSGAVEGVNDTDELQKRVRQAAEKRVYPPIYLGHNCRVLNHDDKDVVAVIVEASKERPHFSGAAYVRVGSESVNASAKQLDELIASRISIAWPILEAKRKNETVLVELIRHTFERYRVYCTVTDCNPHFATFKDTASGAGYSGPLSKITASYEAQMGMLMFSIWNE